MVFGWAKKKKEAEAAAVSSRTAQGTTVADKVEKVEQDFSSHGGTDNLSTGGDVNDSNQIHGNQNALTQTNITQNFYGSLSAVDIMNRALSATPSPPAPTAISAAPSNASTSSAPNFEYFDIDRIIHFDLEQTIHDFKKAVKSFGISAFSLDVPCQGLCRRYLLQRLRHCMEERHGWEVDYRDIHLDDHDPADPESPLAQFEKTHDAPIGAWFAGPAHRNFHLYLWNYHVVEPEEMERITLACRERIQRDHGAALEDAGQCLVIIAISLTRPGTSHHGERVGKDRNEAGKPKIQPIHLPDAFDEEEIRDHFGAVFRKAKIGKARIDANLARLFCLKNDIKCLSENRCLHHLRLVG